MKVKNYRVHYLVKGVAHQTDFSVWTVISPFTVRVSAKSVIRKAHPNENWSDISGISIEEIKVW
jgi:hypothetical protein